MKKLIFLIFILGNLVAQKNIAIVITGYDQKKDDWEKSKVAFVDTSYYQIDEKAWSVMERDSIYYSLFTEVAPKDKSGFDICTFYHYTDFWGSDHFFNAFPVLFEITKRKLISLHKM